MFRIIQNIAGVLLLPFVFAVGWQFYDGLLALNLIGPSKKLFLFGALTYTCMFMVGLRLNYLYVFAHETLHAVFIWLFGGRVKEFKVSSSRGRVKTDTTNVFIELAPYLFPIYTIFLLLLYYFASLFYSVSAFYPYVIFAVGFTVAFHIVMTLDKLRDGQSDFSGMGHILSADIILIVNMIITIFLLVLVFRDTYALSVFVHIKEKALQSYRHVWEWTLLIKAKAEEVYVGITSNSI